MIAPVITIDGPSGVGKGTLCHRLAAQLGWHTLDSGALYRAAAWAAKHYRVAYTDEAQLVKMIHELDIQFYIDPLNLRCIIHCNNEDITQIIREESISAIASQISALPGVRQALLGWQRRFRQPPGLVVDGRDMGTVVFPDANLKIFLQASPEVRAQRRYNQLKDKVSSVTLAQIFADMQARDARDTERSISPLRPADDAIILNTDTLDAEAVYQAVLALIAEHIA